MANIFPRWSNQMPIKIGTCIVFVAIGIVAFFSAYGTPKALVVGYQPSQPIPFSHKIHVDQLGMDCRYCHAFADSSGTAGVPSASTCWNCHQHVQKESPKLAPLHRAMNPGFPGYDGKPIEWVRVHKSPDYVKFDHSAHINRGISCMSCHGQIDQMETVYQAENHSMGWCLNCHRKPELNLRPLEEVYNPKYDPAKYIADHPELGVKTPAELGLKLKEQFKTAPKITCATCHH